MEVSESFLNGVIASFITLSLAMCGFIYKCKTKRLKCGCIEVIRDIENEVSIDEIELKRKQSLDIENK